MKEKSQTRQQSRTKVLFIPGEDEPKGQQNRTGVLFHNNQYIKEPRGIEQTAGYKKRTAGTKERGHI